MKRMTTSLKKKKRKPLFEQRRFKKKDGAFFYKCFYIGLAIRYIWFPLCKNLCSPKNSPFDFKTTM